MVGVEYFLAMAEADAWADELAAREADADGKQEECGGEQSSDEVPK
jgi:hypothetical protein